MQSRYFISDLRLWCLSADFGTDVEVSSVLIAVGDELKENTTLMRSGAAIHTLELA